MKKHLTPINIILWGLLAFLPITYNLSFRELYLFPKWLLLYVTTACVIILALRPKRPLMVPHFPKKATIALGFLIFMLSLNYALHEKHILSTATIDRLTFWVLVLFFYGILSKTYSFQRFLLPIFVGHSLFLLIAYTQLFLLNPLLPATPYMAATLGNINMAAEWVGIAIFFVFYALRHLPAFYPRHSKIMRIWLISLGSFSLSFYYFAVCRSVGIAVTAGILFLVLKKKFISCKQFTFMFMGAVILIGSIHTIFHIQDKEIPELGIIPLGSKELKIRKKRHMSRVHLIENALSTWWDNPLGVGAGRYEFSIMPYQNKLTHTETFTHTSPHSDPLRMLMEDGIGVMLLGGLFFGLLFLHFFPKVQAQLKSDTFIYSLGLSIYFILEGCIQFPLEVPVAFFYRAFILASLFAGIIPSSIPLWTTTWKRPLFLGILSIMYIPIASFITFSRYHERTPNTSLTTRRIACHTLPENHYACRTLAAHYLRQGAYIQALETFLFALKNSPHNFVILRETIPLLKKLGYHEASCQVLHTYDQFFHHRSSLHPFFRKNCRQNGFQIMLSRKENSALTLHYLNAVLRDLKAHY